MSEIDLRGIEWINGYPHDPQTLWGDLYYLALIFAGSEKISEFRSDGEGQYSLFWVFRNTEYSEISRRLISIAAISRNLMEISRDTTIQTLEVGKFYKKSNSDEFVELTFREACNKVIHADHINFDNSEDPAVSSPYVGYLNPIVYLYGTYNGEPWKIELEIFKFIKEAYKYT